MGHYTSYQALGLRGNSVSLEKSSIFSLCFHFQNLKINFSQGLRSLGTRRNLLDFHRLVY